MKNILLIGAGRFGRHIAIQLSQLGHQVMAVDISEDRINDVLPFVTNAQIGDSTNADFLRSLGIGNYDVCIVTIGGSLESVFSASNTQEKRTFRSRLIQYYPEMVPFWYWANTRHCKNASGSEL